MSIRAVYPESNLMHNYSHFYNADVKLTEYFLVSAYNIINKDKKNILYQTLNRKMLSARKLPAKRKEQELTRRNVHFKPSSSVIQKKKKVFI